MYRSLCNRSFMEELLQVSVILMIFASFESLYQENVGLEIWIVTRNMEWNGNMKLKTDGSLRIKPTVAMEAMAHLQLCWFARGSFWGYTIFSRKTNTLAWMTKRSVTSQTVISYVCIMYPMLIR